VPLRGNVDTRLRKLETGDLDAIVLAAAGLTRLGLATRITEYLPTGTSLPAVGQGIVGVECRATPALLQMLLPLEHEPTRVCLTAERAFAARLGASCSSPIAGFARLADGRLTLEGLVGAPDGTRIHRDTIDGVAEDAASLGVQLADRLLAAGAAGLLAELRGAGG
jgi:hydroxymethylbilane synthase